MEGGREGEREREREREGEREREREREREGEREREREREGERGGVDREGESQPRSVVSSLLFFNRLLAGGIEGDLRVWQRLLALHQLQHSAIDGLPQINHLVLGHHIPTSPRPLLLGEIIARATLKLRMEFLLLYRVLIESASSYFSTNKVFFSFLTGWCV